MLAGAELAAGLAIVLLGAVVLGAIGFGLGMVAIPVLLLLLPPQDTVVIVNAMIVLTTGLTLLQTWRHLNLRQSWPFVIAGLPPVPIGVLLLDAANPTALRLTIIVLIMALAVMSMFQIRLPGARRRGAGPVCGFLTTLLVTTLGVGGPLGGLYCIEQDWPRDTIRSTMALYFLLAAGLAMALFAAVGLVSAATAQNIGLLGLATLAGSAIASVVARRMSRRVFRYAALAVTIGGSISLLGRELLRLV